MGRTESKVNPDVVSVVTDSGGEGLHGTGKALLQSIQAAAPVRRFLQSWDASKRRLGYGVGDGKKGVIVHSDGEVTEATSGIHIDAIDTTDRREMVHRSTCYTNDLLTRISSTLKRYVYFDDVRLYLLLSLWALGTYVYAMFSHFGYLHLHSVKKRSGKTRGPGSHSAYGVRGNTAGECADSARGPRDGSARQLQLLRHPRTVAAEEHGGFQRP